MTDKNTGKLLNNLSIETSRPEVAAGQIRTYLQFFSARRQRYNNTNRIIAVLNPEDALILNDEYQRFNNNFNEANKKINEALKNNDISLAIKTLEMFDEIFQKMELVYLEHEDQYKQIPADLSQIYDQLQSDYREVISSLNLQLDNSRSELFGKIQDGIDNLLQLKKELGFTGTFKDKIEREILKSKILSFIYLWSFILTLLLIPLLVITSFIIPDIHTLEWYEALAVRASIVATLVWMATFFHKNYSLRTVLVMKFDHMERLLGGGAATIADLVKSDEPARAEVYRRMSELFLNMDDLSEIVSKELRPTIKSKKEAINLLKEVKSVLKDS
ncbi:MAG: hypothetical protein OQK73_05105 [Gammaproteobacteria bacterium]|nr:hypothetical protein [Gammaproteobacteria bacterium]